MPFNPPLITPHGTSLYYQGPKAEEGRLPAVIFFALSAEASLYADPLNQPVMDLIKENIRVFSWDLPFHSKEVDPKEAIFRWALELAQNPHFMTQYLEICQLNIDYLIEQGLVDPAQLAIAGLSRGAFIATQLAAREERLRTILGFAPLTHPKPFEEYLQSSTIFPSFERLALVHLTHKLIGKNLRFYIGNHDTRVGTANCFEFIQTLTQQAIAHGIRSPQVELIIYPSVGYKGHGTPPSIFQEGAHWIKTKLLYEFGNTP